MGILSGITSNVAIVMKADTSQAKRATKELAGEQKKLAKQALNDLDKQNEKLDQQIKKWGKVAVGVGSAIAAFKIAQGAFNAFAKDAQLRGAAAGISIDKLRKASQGLISDYDLLNQAAALQNTTFKLSQKEMEEVTKFMLVLRKQGNDMAEVQDRVTKAFVEGKVEGLEPFGVVVENVGTKLEKSRNLMKAMRAENDKFKGSLGVAGDEMKKVGIVFDNAVRDMKVAIGGLVNALAPLLKGLALVALGWAKVARAATSSVDIASLRARIDPGKAGRQQQADLARLARRNEKSIAQGIGAFLRQSGIAGAVEGAGGLFSGPAPTRPRRGRGGGGRGGRGAAATFARVPGQNIGGVGPSFGGDPFAVGVGGSLSGFDARLGLAKGRVAFQDEQMAKAKSLVDARDAAAAKTAQGRQNFLESTFGPVGQFDLYAGAFDGLTSAVTASMQAWITGSKSMAAAFTEAISASLSGLAVQMQVEAIKEAAYGFSSIAWGNGGKAAAHFKSAAGFQAGAIAAAVGAKALGGSGAATSAGGIPTGTANVIGASGGGSGDTGRTVNVFVGDDFSRTDQRKRGAQFRRTMRDAMQGGSTTSGVAFG